jgi:type I restriction enzyme R subunit
MNTPSFKEDHISQIPALQLLQNLGYEYLMPKEVEQYRNQRTSTVLLLPIVKEQLKKINSFTYRGKTYTFSDATIDEAVKDLQQLDLASGFMAANINIYDWLTKGKSYDETIGNVKRSPMIRLIDWEQPERNIYHVVEEFSVKREGREDTYRPDIVLFVNGIPLVVIEAKRPDLKEPIQQAISQHLRNQNEDGIRSLFAYSQLLITISSNDAWYGTTATPPKFWSFWREKYINEAAEQRDKRVLNTLKNKSLTTTQKDRLFSERYRYVRNYFDILEQESLQVTIQDELLYQLCRPKRLLDIIYNFILFDDNIKKIARYQQYFAIHKILNRVEYLDTDGSRKGGVIWHTQGSGKSLTMVMLAQMLGSQKGIVNPKIVLVTDRVSLDDQIAGTFAKCSVPVVKAKNGKDLAKILEGKKEGVKDAIITTIINKFKSAIDFLKKPLDDENIFVLVDEGHRTQYGTFHIKMKQTFPKACYIGFTGTPLMKEEKSTARQFNGGIIDQYTILQAVADGAVLPLLFEGRHILQEVDKRKIDSFFKRVSEPLSDYEKVELKKKFSRKDKLNQAELKIETIAYDLSEHFSSNWGNTEFKGQLIAPNKVTAIKYKEYLDMVGKVTSEVVISPPDTREGTDNAYKKANDKVLTFWNSIMDKYDKSPKKYTDAIINAFKKKQHPQIVIVVDKLLTGFDAPRNIVLYVARNLREHTLLQAIARVNRLYEGKDFGFVVDYYGILGNLDSAMNTYSGLESFDEEDIEGTWTSINEEVEKLPQYHGNLWDIFKSIKNKYDEPAYEELLRDEAIRVQFYDRLTQYLKTFKIALSSLAFNNNTDDAIIQKYNDDAKFFLKLRISVKKRFSDATDLKKFDSQVQQLIDKHVSSDPDEILKLTELVNIFDEEKFQAEVEKVVGKAAKADTISSRTSKHINENMDKDPAFFKSLSEMLQQAIDDYKLERITEAEYLKMAKEAQEKAKQGRTADVPTVLVNRDVARAFYGLLLEPLKDKVHKDALKSITAEIAIQTNDLIKSRILDDGYPIIDWHKNDEIIRQMKQDLDDLFFDISTKNNISLAFDVVDSLIERIVNISKVRYK